MKIQSNAGNRIFAAISFLTVIGLTGIFFSACFPERSRTRLISAKNAEHVTRFEISSPRVGYPIVIEKSENAWVFIFDGEHRYPADQAHVVRFLSALSAPRVIQPVFGDRTPYGIDEKSSTRIKAFIASGKNCLDILAGNASADDSSQFFYDALTGKSYRSAPNLSGIDESASAYWVNLSPFAALLHDKEIERIMYHWKDIRKAYKRGEGVESDQALDAFQESLSALFCVDITNIPVDTDELITLELSDLTSMRLGIRRLNGDYAIVRDESTGNSWIITEMTRKKIESGF